MPVKIRACTDACCVQIATGATACVPDIPGLKLLPYLTNETVFNLTELPTRLLVLGSGPIGELLQLQIACSALAQALLHLSSCLAPPRVCSQPSLVLQPPVLT